MRISEIRPGGAVRSTAIALTVLCLASFVMMVAASAFNTRGEPREAIVAMSMLQDGNWILPINNGDEIAFKPPLLHWLIALFSLPFGEISVGTSRLPSALAATAMTVATYVFFARRAGQRVALTSALVLLTAFEVHRAALTCRVDMLLAALTVMAFYAFYAWGERGLRGVPWAGLLCVAGAALTKGPVGVVLPCGVVAVYLWLRGEARFTALLWRFALMAIAGLLPLLLWYVAAYAQPHGGERFLRLVYEENVLRFTGQMSYASHINPWYYNVMTVVAGMLPYTLALLIALPLGIKALRRAGRHCAGWCGALRHPVAAARRMERMDCFALVGFAVVFLFYCIPASKRSVYLLPLYPFAAWYAARFLVWLACSHRRYMAAFSGTMLGVNIILLLAYLALQTGLAPTHLFATGRHADETLAYVDGLANQPWGLFVTVCAVVPLVAAVAASRRRFSQPLSATFLTAALWITFEGVYKPPIAAAKSDATVAAYLSRVQPTGTIYSFRTDVLEANRMHPFTINFYLGDRVIPIDKATPLPSHGLLIVGNDEAEAFSARYPQYAVALVRDTRHRSCDDRKTVRIYRFVRKG